MLKHGGLGELNALLARGVRPLPRHASPAPLAAAQEPPAALESKALNWFEFGLIGLSS